MSVKVEFKDGTAEVFKKGNDWERDARDGFYRIKRTTKKGKPETTYKSRWFSRKVISNTTEQEYNEETIAFIEIGSVVSVEEL